MSRESLVIVLGLVVFFVPSFGIPESWKMYILYGVGVVLMIVGYILRRASYMRSIDTGNGERATDSFVESDPEALQEKE